MVFSFHIYRFVVTVYSEFQPNPFAVKSKKVSNPFWTSSGTYYLRFCSWKLLDSHTSMCSIPPHLQGIDCISGTSLHNFAIHLPVISVFVGHIADMLTPVTVTDFFRTNLSSFCVSDCGVKEASLRGLYY